MKATKYYYRSETSEKRTAELVFYLFGDPKDSLGCPLLRGLNRVGALAAFYREAVRGRLCSTVVLYSR